MTLDDKLREIEERCEKATPGPWEADEYCYEMRSSCGKVIMCSEQFYPSTPEDDEDWYFIAYARQDIPYLLSTIKRMKEALETIKNSPFSPDIANDPTQIAKAALEEVSDD